MIETSNKKEGWPECFQDLGSWCPLPQDELHTPKVNLQDEFNFSNDHGYVNEWDQLSSPLDFQCDPWVNDSQLGLSSCQTGIGDFNTSVIEEGIPLGTIQKTTNILGSGGKLLTVTSDRCRSPLKSKGNVLLSQGIVKSVPEDSTLLNMAATLEHKSKDSIVIANNCYLLPVTVPEFDSAKLNSSSLSRSYLTTAKTPLQLSLTQASLPPTKKVSIVNGNTLKSALSNQTNFLENLHIKEEEQGIDKCFKLPPVAIEGGNNDVEPVQDQRRVKPQLKLNIAAANNASKFTTTLSTPEVLRPLVDEDTKEFNLLQYVCNDGEYSGLIQEDEEESRPVEEQAHRDHDYTTDPYSKADVKSDLIIKCEPGSPASESCTVKKSNTKRGRPKRKRQRDDSSDYVVSDSDESLSEDDSQQEWIPAQIKRKKRKSSTNSNKNKLTGGRKSISRRTSTSSNNNNNLLDIEEPTHDKYRALRERNNEASRRSRMNRKQRDVEMLQQADELHKKNVYLKARAEKMECLVKYMRAEIMKALTKPK